MDWPIQPVEIQRRFVPRFCPWRECPRHRLAPRDPLPFRRVGSYARRDGRRVPRYRCPNCRRTFSKQTFAVSYFLKRPELLVPVCAGLQAGSAHRQIARSLGCAPSTVTRLSARLGRHALLLLTNALSHLESVPERLVADHFESFARSQDYPLGIATVVGRDSWFVYALDPAPHPRTGRRSPYQELRRKARPPQDTRGGHAGSFERSLDLLLQFFPDSRPLRITTDGHEDYARVARKPKYRGRLVHHPVPNPPRGPKGAPRSPEARLRDEAMFPNDVLHMLLRHTKAHHRRETIAFGRRANALMERMFLTAVWRNFVKGVSERKPDPTTPAMRLGIASSPWTWPRVLARRLFPDRLPVPESWIEIYRRAWITPGGPNAPHDRVWAF